MIENFNAWLALTSKFDCHPTIKSLSVCVEVLLLYYCMSLIACASNLGLFGLGLRLLWMGLEKRVLAGKNVHWLLLLINCLAKHVRLVAHKEEGSTPASCFG